MKKLIVLVAILSLTMAGVAFATVVDSKHDLSTGNSDAGGSTTQVCVFCHHPHGNDAAQNDLLWNINDVTSNYVTYGSTATTTTPVTGAAATAPQSELCMGCHDGESGSNTFKKSSAADGALGSIVNLATLNSDRANLGETLADDHPVGFQYPLAGYSQIGDLALPSAGVVATDYPLFSGNMECATCHDVHAGTTSQDDTVQFMRGNSDRSAICIDCHTAK